jgi:hypothetical protein
MNKTSRYMDGTRRLPRTRYVCESSILPTRRIGAARRAVGILLRLVGLFVLGQTVAAGAEELARPSAPVARIVLRSSNFALTTDLSRAEAQPILARMETAIKSAARYWQRPPRGQIACYIVADLANWPDSALPHPLARVWVGGVGGATIAEYVGAGRETRIRATVYAVPRRGVAEHEVIHAYCYQTFGEAGPEWYKEGMAQWVSLGSEDGAQSGCPPELVQGLGKGTSATVQEVVQAGRFTVGISDSCGAMLVNRSDLQAHVPLSDWTAQDDETVRLAEHHYMRSWALCHMLLCNPNYAVRFRELGNSYVTKGGHSFDNAFASVSDELAFEHAFFLQHLDVGYRVDLCHWDWQKRFRTLDAPDMRGTAGARIEAARGYQASGLTVVAGHSYAYAATGSWGTSVQGPTTCANGDADGRGRMMAVVLDAFRLGEPFELGSMGTFEAPHGGNLYLRCRDEWNQLHDNHGSVHVRFTRPARGRD